MSSTDIAAWWGAITATVVLIWDVFKWAHAGPDVRVSVSSGMKGFNAPQFAPEQELIVVEAVNVGDRPTTITHLVGLRFHNIFQRLRQKNNSAFFVANPGCGQPIPFLLKPGERWMGAIEQKAELADDSEGDWYCGIYHSGKRRPVLQRLIIHPDPQPAK